jgi:predicted ATPase
VLEPVTAIIGALLGAAPAVTVLTTGREPLQMRDEQIWPVGALETDEVASPGVQLFVERARAADPSFDLEKSEAAVLEICRRLDGVPLAIELAAARTRMLSIDDIAGRLDERFRLLKGTRRGGDPRHQTLLDAVSWSYELLDEDERALFDRLSVFAGPFELQVAEAVCAPDDDLNVLDALTGLVDRSMLAVRRTSLGTRYELLETLRAFGADRLADSERIGLYRRHGAHYLRVAELAAAGLDGPDEAKSISELDQAFANIRAAYRYGVETDDPHLSFGLIAAMREYAFRTMRYEVTTWADASLTDSAAANSAPSLDAVVKGVAAHGAFVRGEYERALVIAQEVRALERATGVDPSGLAERAFVNVYSMIGPLEKGTTEAGRQIEAATQSGNKARQAHALYMGAVLHASRGETEAAKLLLEQAEAAATSSGSPTALAGAAYARGLIFEAADPEAALETLAGCDQASREAGNRWMSAFARTSTASILLSLGHLDRACELLADVLDTWHRAGDWSQQWLTLNYSIVALATIGDSELATQVTGAVETHAVIGAAPASASERDRVIATVSQLQSDLGTKSHDFHRNQGRQRPVDDLVAAVRQRLVTHQ